jgi:signal transduction histidine kinase
VPATWPAGEGYTAALIALMAVTALLPIRIDDREEHVALWIVTAAAGGMVGAAAVVLLWAAVAAALPVAAARPLLASPRRVGRDRARSVEGLLLSAAVGTAGVLAAAAFRGVVQHGTVPVTAGSAGELLAGTLTLCVGWAVGTAARLAALRLRGQPFLPWSPSAFDSALVPYLLPCVVGFPLVTAAVVAYDPDDPWTSLVVLAWVLPVHAATAYQAHRREMAHELRRDALARQRLAAIGEVSARIVHQSRHQVGLMGWSIHRLRAVLDRVATLPAPRAPDVARELAAAERELDALVAAKDRLSAALTAELLLGTEGDDGGVGGTGDDARPPSHEPAGLPARALVADVVAQLRDKAGACGVTLDVTANGDCATRVPDSVRDAVFNLVDNALDAARSGVRVSLHGTGTAATIGVADDGSGLADDLAHAVLPFSTTKAGGTGMGLPIADALVSDVGGTLRYERSTGTTTFTVELPSITTGEGISYP